MERAVELMAVDPVVNDHLGDVYWAVGRTREARFQWSRALSFIDEDNNDSDADPDRIADAKQLTRIAIKCPAAGNTRLLCQSYIRREIGNTNSYST